MLLAGQKSGIVHALDPDKEGAILWQTRVGKGGTSGGVQWGMAADGAQVYAATSDMDRKFQNRPLDPQRFVVDRNAAAASPRSGLPTAPRRGRPRRFPARPTRPPAAIRRTRRR